VQWAEQSRARYGTHVGMAQADEGTYLVALQAALKLVYKSDFKRAAASAAALHQKFPKSLAQPLVTCEVAIRRRKVAAANTSCQQVLRLHPDNSWARYLLGIGHLRAKDTKAGVRYLRQAIEKDPGLEAAYKALAKVYGKTSNPALAELRQQYKAQFNRDL